MLNKLLLFTGTCLCVYLVFVARPAFAEEKAEAKKHFKVGLKLLQGEDFQGAALEFEASVKLYSTKNGLFNLANCYKALQRYAEALEAIGELKSQFSGKLDKDWLAEIEAFETDVEGIVARLEIKVNVKDALVQVGGKEVGTSPLAGPVLLGPGVHEVAVSKQEHKTIERKVTLVSGDRKVESFELDLLPGELTVKANVAGATVFVDERRVGETPLLSEPIAPGEHRVRVVRDGYEELKREAVLRPGEPTTMQVILTPIPAPKLVAKPEPEPPKVKPVSAKEKDLEKSRRIGPWVFLGVGVASGIAAAITGTKQLKKTEALKEKCVNNDCDPSLEGEKDDAWALGTATNVLVGVAVVSTIIGLASMPYGKDDDEKEKAVSFAPTATPDGAALSITGSF